MIVPFRLTGCVCCLFLLFSGWLAQAQGQDNQPYAGLSPEEAVKKMTLPPGFKATIFASEPDVRQPIAFAIDDRGRVWVAEAYTYPFRTDGDKGKDRILIFEDTNGDGKFDKRTVFMEGFNLISGLAVGFGGVWVGAAPYLMYIPMKDGDEPKPAGKPQILLDGFAYGDPHEVLNTFTWGPDGWLYGCHGIVNTSNIGPPGSPDGERTKINAGVWRFHPIKHIFERFSEGTSNPWGMDFDEHGQCITEACVIPHLFHMIQSGHFTRQMGTDFNPCVYDDIKTIADHLHWDAELDKGPWNPWHSKWSEEAFGGGHAHSGLLIYQGDNWPEQYYGKIFMNNIHGACINMDIPESKGSGFVAHHGQNFIKFNDPWSLVVNLQTGPDGSVYMIDWYDQLKCYDPKDIVDRSNGRIYKISCGNTKFQKVDLSAKPTLDLVELLGSKNNWYARHAQRLLQERCGGMDATPGLRAILKNKILDPAADPVTRLRHVWALAVVDGSARAQDAIMLLRSVSAKSSDEYIRAWLIQILCEDPHPSPEMLGLFVRLAREDKSPVVRLYLASALQRLPLEDRWTILAGLCSHAGDAEDHNLPLMIWYAAEPLVTNDCERALKMAESARLPDILEFTVRRAAALGTPGTFDAIFKSLLSVNDKSRLMEILQGFSDGIEGQRSLPTPQGWSGVETKLRAISDADIVARVQSLSLIFGGSGAIEAVLKTLVDPSADETARRAALASLLEVKAPDLAKTMRNLLDEKGRRTADLRKDALRGLAAYSDDRTPPKILSAYASLNPDEKRIALHTLTARVSFGRALMTAVGAGAIPRDDMTADLVQELRNLRNSHLNEQTAKIWGSVHESTEDKKALIGKYKLMCSHDLLARADPWRGRAVFARLCQQCHTLFDTGGKIGPNLTVSNRRDLNFLMESIVDPSAIIPKDYRAWTLETDDGRSVTGIMKRQDENTVTIASANETLIVPRKEIKSLQESAVSFMPEGLLDTLTDDDVRNLILYLSREHPLYLPIVKP